MHDSQQNWQGVQHHLQKHTKIEKNLLIMDWVDLLMQIDFLPIVAPDRFDVVSGRGQGIQRLPGNKTYRELVSMNKVRRYCLHLNCRFLQC